MSKLFAPLLEYISYIIILIIQQNCSDLYLNIQIYI